VEHLQGMEKEMKKQFRDFESARDFVRSLGLKNDNDWREYCKSGDKPDNIPSVPNQTYKNEGYIHQGDWLGTGKTSKTRNFRPFKEAREFTISLNLKGTKEWQQYCKSGNKPGDIPSTPSGTYKNEFKGLGDWLGTGTIASYNKQFRPFTEARASVRLLNLKNFTEWQVYCKSGNKPDNIPSNPNATYKNDGYVDLGDWLGTGVVSQAKKVYRPFIEAREYVRLLNLKNFTEWQVYCKSGNKPDNIPSTPNQTYKNDGYVDLGDWLGTGVVSQAKKQFRPFTQAREFTISLNLKNQKEWTEYCSSGNKPDDIPSNPQYNYKNDFKGYGNWLGTGRIADQDKVYRPFKDARKFVRSLGLKNHKEWKEYCNSGNKPDDIPRVPWSTYKEWKKK
jgi:hypothetical protein